MTPAGDAATCRKTSVLGTWRTGYAWSTSKVPVAIASLRESDTAFNRSVTRLAITQSDNGAAGTQRTSLGSRADAAAKITSVLRDLGDETVVPTGNESLSGYGRLRWSLAGASVFAGSLANSKETAARYVLWAMGDVVETQSWGLGTIVGASFKGGWAPADGGGYLTRQLGVIRLDDGRCWGVAIASENELGFDAAQQDMTLMAQWLEANITSYPAGTCPALP